LVIALWSISAALARVFEMPQQDSCQAQGLLDETDDGARRLATHGPCLKASKRKNAAGWKTCGEFWAAVGRGFLLAAYCAPTGSQNRQSGS
jgi:hypothetical protein